eukprot:TRINITY_DN80559_c0_g1_i1.p2 TRINITY_DN80559_c0_g1~~TRINITY_DN80559_c0_g1_i1.p2  ORF type:complete len:134 (+),score=1.89 TRINITY_DN80559_c0_g1_i1:285-686(+)
MSRLGPVEDRLAAGCTLYIELVLSPRSCDSLDRLALGVLGWQHNIMWAGENCFSCCDTFVDKNLKITRTKRISGTIWIGSGLMFVGWIGVLCDSGQGLDIYNQAWYASLCGPLYAVFAALHYFRRGASSPLHE